MRLILFLLVVALVVCACSAETNLYGSSIRVHSTVYTETGDNLQVWPYAQTEFNSRASGKSYTTAVDGKAKYSSSDTIGDGYLEESSTLAFDGGAVGYDTLATDNLKPNESELECIGDKLAVAGEDGITSGSAPDEKHSDSMVGFIGLTGGKFEVDKFADDGGVYSISSSYTGDGRADGRTSYIEMSGEDKNSTEMNEYIEKRERFQVLGNKTSPIKESGITWTNSYVDEDVTNSTS